MEKAKVRISKIAAMLTLCAVSAVSNFSVAQQKKTSQQAPIVVVISLDAFGAALLDQPLLPVPTLHALMASGSYARSMQPVNPTVTWPNHTSMVTGVVPAKHGVIANGKIINQRTDKLPSVDASADKTELVHVPTVYDRAHGAGLTTAEMDWVAILNATSINWSFAEEPVATSPLIKEMLADGSLTQAELKTFDDGPQANRDRLYTRGAIYSIKRHHPNLVLLHLLALDDVEHEYGFDTTAGQNTAAFLDDRVKEVIDAVREAGDLDRTTFLIVSDHGQSSVHHTVDPNAILTDAGIPPSEATALAEGGVAYIYEAHPSAQLSEKIRAIFLANPATDSVPNDQQIAAQGWPTHKDDPASFDILAYAKEDWQFGGKAVKEHRSTSPTVEEQTGTHGYPNTRPLMQEIFIANGAAIRSAGEQPPFPNLNVAATIAKILDLPQTGMDGKPLDAILK
jgi:predicted AlkP superfamily pyrophosphatase or phosphodiesterase